MSQATLDTLYAAAVAALDGGDYETAIAKATAAKIRLATMPAINSNAGSGSQSLAWPNASAIDGFITECRKAKAAALAAASGPLQYTKITYARPTSTAE